MDILHTNLLLPIDNAQRCAALRYTLQNEVAIDIKFLAAKALTELHKNYNNLILSMDLDESYTISPTDSIATIRDKCKIAFKYGAHHYPMLMTYAVSSGMGLDDPSLTSTGLSEGEVGEGIDYPLSGLVGAYNSNLPILKKPLLLKYADDESGMHRDDDDYEATDTVDEADSSTERVRRYYKRHPKKVSKYLKDTVQDRVARNRDRRKAVKKHGKNKMKNHDVHHPKGPNGGSWRLAKKDHGRDKVKECYSPDGIAMNVQQFVTYAAVRLNLQQTPVVSLMPADKNLTSLGKYDVISNQIFVVVEDRLLADILRTIAHEMAHQKQNELGYITNPAVDGATGSRIENNANIIAGILLRDYGKVDNSIYISENTIKCRVCGWAWDSTDGGKHPFVCHKCWNTAGRYLMEAATLLLEAAPKSHVNHPYDDADMPISEFKDIIDQSLLGNFDDAATEKYDGQTLLFTMKDGKPLFARNTQHTKNKGGAAMSAEEYKEFFSEHGDKISRVFGQAASDMAEALLRLPPDVQKSIFGDGSNFVLSELLSTELPNTIPYGSNRIVLLNVRHYDPETGNPTDEPIDRFAADKLVGELEQHSSVDGKTFKIGGNTRLQFDNSKKDEFEKKKNEYFQTMDGLLQSENLDDSSTLGDYYATQWQKLLDDTGLEWTPDEREKLTQRWVHGDKSFGSKDIKDKEKKTAFQAIEKDYKQHLARIVDPIKTITLQVGNDALSRANNIVSRHDGTEERLRRTLKTAVDAIKDSGVPEYIEKARENAEQLRKLGGDNISPSEGLIIQRDGKMYKLTGSFAPLNQIIGTYTYKLKPESRAKEPTDIKSVTDKLQFKPVTKKALPYKPHGEIADSSALEDMGPMSFATATSEMKVVTITADGKETENTAAPGDIIMSGPSGEKYVVKAAKFEKLYAKQDDGTVIPEQSPRQVARYDGKDEVTFTAPWGEQMVLKPGDYLVKDGDGFYRIAKKEYEITYNLPDEPVSDKKSPKDSPTEPPKKPIRQVMTTAQREKAKGVLAQHIMNPETNNRILVKTALKYDPTHPARIAADALVKKSLTENVLFEGGKATNQNSKIPNEYSEPTVSMAADAVGLGSMERALVGSTHKPLMNDLDVAVDIEDIKKMVGYEGTDNKELFAQLKAHLGDKGLEITYSPGFQQFSVLAPLVNDAGEQQLAYDETGKQKEESGSVQVDFMMGSLPWMKRYLTNGDESKYSSTYRNILVADILGVMIFDTEDPEVKSKYQVNPKNGVEKILYKELPNGKKDVIEKKFISDDPDELAKIIFGEDASFSDIDTFEKLNTTMTADDSPIKELVPQIRERYVAGLTKMKKEVPTEIPQEMPDEPVGEKKSKQPIAVYPGRFQPYHAGHQVAYDALVEKFGKGNVYIVTSNKQDSTTSPFGFDDKQEIMTTMFGISEDHIIQVKNPYNPRELLDQFPEDTPVVMALGEKDADRLGGKYFQRYADDSAMEGNKTAGYIWIAPPPNLEVNGKEISGSQLRAVMGDPNITDRAKQEIFTKVYGKFDPAIFKKIVKATTESEEAAKLTDTHGKTAKKKSDGKQSEKAKKAPDAEALGRARDVLKQKVKNPKTNREILVATALKYAEDEPVRKAAERMIQAAMKANESIITENTKSEKMKVYVYVRDYTKDELENEVGEYFENERTIEAFPDLADSAEEIKKLILSAPSEVLTKEELEQLSNSDVPDILSSKNPKQILKQIANNKKDVKGILTAIKGHEKLPEPIVIKHSNGYYLMGGNTRLSALAAMKHTMPVKVIQYGAPMVGSVPTTAAEKPKGKNKGNKKALFQKILQMKITNPETGNLIKIDTAMDYDRLHPAHKVAMGVIRQHMRGISNRAGIPKNRTD